LKEHEAIGELVSTHYSVSVDDDYVAFLYKPIACHSYNKIMVGNDVEVCVATIDTMLTFYLAFMYAKKQYYKKDRIICMAMFLFRVQQKNRLSQKGLLKRFTIDCYGKQPTLEDIRAKKAEKIRELYKKKGTREYDEWFLKYNPNMGKGERKPIVSEKDPILNSVFKKTSGFEKVIEEKEKAKVLEKELEKPKHRKTVEKRRKKNKTNRKRKEKKIVNNGFLF
jgi:hypothetical protein